MNRRKTQDGGKDMKDTVEGFRSGLAILTALAMLFSTGIIFSGKIAAEPIKSGEETIPPIPPYTIYGIFYDETGAPVSDATVTITNLRTGELLDATFYDGGAYETILEDLPNGYAIGDEIEITATTGTGTVTRVIVVKQIGFGERVDIRLVDPESLDTNENVPALSTVQSNHIESDTIPDEPLISSPKPPRTSENSRTIVIDSPTTIDAPSPICHPGHPHPPVQPAEYNVSFVEIRAPPYYRLAFTGPEKENQLELKLVNEGRLPTLIKVSLFMVEPDGTTESFLKTTTPTAIPNGHQKTITVFRPREDMWQPTQTGRNWIRGEIYVTVDGNNNQSGENQNERQDNEKILVNTFKESFNVVPGWRPVMQIHGDWNIDAPTTILNRTIIVDGGVNVNANLYLNYGTLIAGDLNVSATKTIGASEDIDLWCNYSGEYKVEVRPSGTLNIYGKIWNNPQQNHYWFFMNGTLNISRYPPDEPTAGIVENTYGNTSDPSQPGGIICTTNNVLI